MTVTSMERSVLALEGQLTTWIRSAMFEQGQESGLVMYKRNFLV